MSVKSSPQATPFYEATACIIDKAAFTGVVRLSGRRSDEVARGTALAQRCKGWLDVAARTTGMVGGAQCPHRLSLSVR